MAKVVFLSAFVSVEITTTARPSSLTDVTLSDHGAALLAALKLSRSVLLASAACSIEVGADGAGAGSLASAGGSQGQHSEGGGNGGPPPNGLR
jgi:hypothetical protein